ncbi:MAG: heme lyase CcmF/NrfE family subunit [Halieaceae bacterium]|nr:heme lyase CcmF/NrfE family subunit [Halieaceae bacterium]
MIPEYGHFALILALCLAALQATLPMAGAMTNRPRLMAMARPLAAGQFCFVAIAFAVLGFCFLQDDFSVAVVAANSNSQLPAIYKFSATWGNHEGSLLLWLLILAAWSLAVAIFSRQLPLDMVARVLSVMGMIAVGFLLFSLLTSNPFARHLPHFPIDGNDLNPLLQDPGLIVHPPLLYAGYVGFSVAFAFAIAALSSGRLDAAWARWSRPWTTVAWAFLTVGIALGSWWAYYELGWGGWWFWDPVENASIMPWLVGTALIHSLAVTEKRGVFKSLTVLLAILTFSLSLLGAFLVRSGVLTSVHSFAADPSRGLFILIFLALVIGGSLILYALRAPTVASKVHYGGWSRELLLLINNVLLLVAMLTVLFGTLFPLVMDALNYGKYSVGPPYFNAVFVPLMAILFVFMGLGPTARWKRTELGYLGAKLWMAALVSVVVGLLFPLVYDQPYNIWAALAVCFAMWLLLSTWVNIKLQLRNAGSVMTGLGRLSPSYYGMVLAHIGTALCVIGVCLNTQYTEERDVRMEAGQAVEVAGYRFAFESVRPITGKNFSGQEALIKVYQGDKLLTNMYPQKRSYNSNRGMMMTEVAIDAGLWRDLYIALGEPLEGGAWAVRLHYEPFVRWIWLGGLLMTFGGLLAACDKRYRLKLRSKIGAPAVAEGAR